MTVSTLVAVIEPERSQEFFGWLAGYDCTVREVESESETRAVFGQHPVPLSWFRNQQPDFRIYGKLALGVDFQRSEDAALCRMFFDDLVMLPLTQEQIEEEKLARNADRLAVIHSLQQALPAPPPMVIIKTELHWSIWLVLRGIFVGFVAADAFYAFDGLQKHHWVQFGIFAVLGVALLISEAHSWWERFR